MIDRERDWDKVKNWMMGTLAVVFVIGFTLLVTWVGISENNESKQEFRTLCSALNSEFISEPEWMCVRDGDIVYRESDE